MKGPVLAGPMAVVADAEAVILDPMAVIAGLTRNPCLRSRRTTTWMPDQVRHDKAGRSHRAAWMPDRARHDKR